MKIHFDRHEYETQEQQRIAVELGTIREKVQSASFQKLADQTEAIEQRRQALKESDVDMQAVDWWLLLHSHRYAPPGLTPLRQLHLLEAILDLRRRTSADILNESLVKVAMLNDPVKASIPYLRTVVQNTDVGARCPVPGKGTAHRAPTVPATEENLSPETVWPRVLTMLKQRINEQSYNTWLRPTRLQSLTRDEAIISVPDDLYSTWLSEHYIGVICEAIARTCGIMPAVYFEVD